MNLAHRATRWNRETARVRRLTTCSRAHAERPLRPSHNKTDFFRKPNPVLFIAIDGTAFECSMKPVMGYAPRGSRRASAMENVLGFGLEAGQESIPVESVSLLCMKGVYTNRYFLD